MINTTRTILIALILLLIPSAAFAGFATNIKDDPTADLIIKLLANNGVELSRLHSLSNSIKKAEYDYGVNPVLLIAVIEEDKKYPGFPDARVYLYNVDSGIIISHERVEALPCPYSDVDRVARALANQLQTFNNDIETSIAAYFFGPALMRRHTIDDLNEEGRQIIQNVKDFIRDNPDNRNSSTSIMSSSRQSNPQNPTQASRQGFRRDNLFSMDNEREFSSIEEKYIAIMRHFNRNLDQATASEIYWAISTMYTQYPNVDARLVMALFAVESSFRPDAVSHKGAQGLGQLMPFTADSLNVNDPFNCTENVRGTFIYLDREFERWKDHPNYLDLVLASYNAGPNAVKRHGNNIPPFKETQDYVPKVLNIYERLLPRNEVHERLRGKTRFYGSLVNR